MPLHTVRGSSLSFPHHFPPSVCPTETSLKRQFYDVQNFLTRSTHHCCRAIVIDVYSTMNRNTVLHLSLYFDKSVRHDMKLFIDSLKMYNYIVIKF